MKKRIRTLQPPHPSDNFTYEEAIAAWRIVEGRTGPAEPQPIEDDPAPTVRVTRRSTTAARQSVADRESPRRNTHTRDET